jgi:hypothetical protein
LVRCISIFWNLVTFFALLVIFAAFTYAFVWLLMLPGKLAVKRQHPHAEAVKLMGNLGFLGGIPWLHALIWSIHDSITIDIRRFPEEEREHVRQTIEKLGGAPEPSSTSKPEVGDEK